MVSTIPLNPQKLPLLIKSFSHTGQFTGYASCYNIDLEGDQIMPHAFERTIKDLGNKQKRLWILWQHQMDQGPIGFCQKVWEDNNGLKVEGQLLLWKEQGRNAYDLIKKGIVKGLSIGFIPTKSHRDPVSKIRKIFDLELREISLVNCPANPSAHISIVKCRNQKMPHPFLGAWKMGP
jgi:uncharacterized protein